MAFQNKQNNKVGNRRQGGRGRGIVNNRQNNNNQQGRLAAQTGVRNAPIQKKNFQRRPQGGRGGFRPKGNTGRGRGRFNNKDSSKSSDDLDAELDSYMLQDQESGSAYLDQGLDDYFKDREAPKGDGEAEVEGEVADVEPEAGV
uniref:Chromatin target of PRMT1 protein C-terminal domain-containing protein n=1 Tax=Polytomella parva TaxID=51329 RepID=A0A7S0VCC0_9CHLO|mmetsp:Transcript_32787/g.59415  ORF Transcript_32787/g.59415 Transcript_32787/m.59415 type:complete len:144 (+) Transcript_32787:69-500(+)